jgi:signal recognition particle GTPase
MIPGVPQDLLAGNDEDAGRRLKRMMIITDSMTAAELDSDGMCFMQMDATGKEPIGITWRVTRVARGSGASVREVEELLCQYRMMANMAKQAGGKNGWYVCCKEQNVQLSFSADRWMFRPHFIQAERSAKDAGCGRDTKRSGRNAFTGTDRCGAGI